MAKKIKTIVKLQVIAGGLEPSKIGQALGPHGLNLQQFMQQVNEATKDKEGQVVPVEITIYEDRSFTFQLKTPPASALIKKAAGIAKGSGTSGTAKVGTITKRDLRAIAERKMEDLNTETLEAAMQIIAGTARNMGIDVIEE